VNLSTGEAYLAQFDYSRRPIGPYEHQIPDRKYIPRSMNQATHNNIPTLPAKTPKNQESAPIPLSQHTTTIPTHGQNNISQAGPSRDGGPTNASLHIKVVEYSTPTNPKENGTQ
jgi:hypothetical protein